MKKILFTLLLVVGGFVAQAQNTFTIGFFETEGQRYIHVVDDINACYNNYANVTYSVYTLASDGASYTITDQDGVVSPSRSIFPSARAEWATTFGQTLSFIRPVDASGNGVFGRAHDDQAKNQG